MVIFRENSEDIYAGIQWEAGTPEVKKIIDFLRNEMGVTKIRFPEISGIGMASGANLSDKVAVFEATHGTAPKYAGKDRVNPASLILSAELVLRHPGWNAAADLIVKGLSGLLPARP